MGTRLGINFREYFAKELPSLDDLETDGLAVSDLGRLLVRIMAMRFDAYLPKPTERRHAMTI